MVLGNRGHVSLSYCLLFYDKSGSLENRTPLDIIYLEFSRAFDSVPHNKLLYKLKSYGICNNVSNWLRSFLTKENKEL